MKVPVVSSFRRFDVIANEHPNYAGWLGFGSNKTMLDYIKNADIMLVIGCRLSQVTSQDYTLVGDHTEVIQVDIEENSIGKSYPVSMGIISDTKLFLEKCLEFSVNNENKERNVLLKKCHDNYLLSSTPPEASKNASFVEMNYVMQQLRTKLPKDTIITSDAGNFFGWITNYYRFSKENTCIGTTAGAMGYGLP